MKDIKEFINSWYGYLDELVEELTDEGYLVLEANGEYITCAGDEDDLQYIIHLGGTARTISITGIEEIEL